MEFILPYPHKRRRTKNTADTRQTDHKHQRWHLIWKDKIKYRSDHNDQSGTTHPLEVTSPDARTRTHRENDTCRRPSIPRWSTDQHGTEKWTLRWTTTLHIQKKTKTHLRTKHTYTWHTRQIPPNPSQHFIAITHMSRKFTRQMQVPTGILDNRQVSTSSPSFSLWLYRASLPE